MIWNDKDSGRGIIVFCALWRSVVQSTSDDKQGVKTMAQVEDDIKGRSAASLK